VKRAVILTLLLAGCGGAEATKPVARTATPTPTPQPPILPDKRVVAFYGNPADRQLGILGIGSPDLAGRRLVRQAKAYARKTRPVQPAMELLAVVANADPGVDGLYRRRERAGIIRRYLKAARKVKARLILDIQPGRADFFSETVHLKKWLEEPDVDLALDPEWRVVAGQVPGDVIGAVSSREVNATTAWLEKLVVEQKLPPKLVVIHQFTHDMVRDKHLLQDRPHLSMVLNADGFGGREVKIAKYKDFVKGPRFFHDGFKLFYEEDTGLMKPAQVMRLKPPPDFIVYE
jgi:hypothetical protein